MSICVLKALLASLFAGDCFCNFLDSFSDILLFGFYFARPHLALRTCRHNCPIAFTVVLVISVVAIALTVRGVHGTRRGRHTTIHTGGRRLHTSLLHAVSRSLHAPLASVSNGTSGLVDGCRGVSSPAHGRAFLSVCSSSV